jgi:hypothetical protein
MNSLVGDWGCSIAFPMTSRYRGLIRRKVNGSDYNECQITLA